MACNPDHTDQIKRINRIIGQLKGVKNQIESNTYCPKILIQTKAISSAVRSLETNLLEKHIHHCVKDAFQSGVGVKEKTEELVEIFKTRIK
jgi:DNA-binding FrmR family transcriptional regulator